MEKQQKWLAQAFGVILAVAAIVSIAGIVAMSGKPVVLQGQVEATEIRISGKLPGRIDSFYVSEGEAVRAGDTLVRINSPEATAKFRQVNALEDVAEYQNRKVDGGTRIQLVRSAEEFWNKTKSDLALAETTCRRITALWQDSVVSSQRRDEAEALRQSALAAEQMAHQQYLLALEGVQPEDRESTRALVEAARAGVEQVEALLADACLTAPDSGEIASIYPKRGELVGAGMSIMSLVILSDCHVVLNVREDYMPHFRMEECFTGRVPALGGQASSFRIYYISPLGSYATWRSTKQAGSYDMCTFEIHARPERPLPGLRPGMSVLVDL